MPSTYVPNTIPEDYREKSAKTQDIEFLIEDKTSGEMKKLGAHKFVLALNSEAFEAQMYGELKEKSGSITIVDSSFEGFERFLNALYGKTPDWSKLNIDELLELNYLSTKYLVNKLCEVVLEAITELVATKENLKDMFQQAEQSSHLDKIAKELYKKCYNFYASLSAQDITDLMCQYGNNVDDVQLLIKMMAGFKLQPPKPRSSCKYCQCPEGKHIEQMPKEELAIYLKEGMRVVRSDEWDYGKDHDSHGPGTIVSALGVNTIKGCIKVKWDNGHTGGFTMGHGGKYSLKLAP